MRLHRFYVQPDVLELTQRFWVNDKALLSQWTKVLRYRKGDELVLFDGVQADRLYRIHDTDENGIHLELVTELDRKLPAKHVYLFFSLLKKDKNEWVMQKGTELGVSNFVPVIASRSEKTGFNEERARRIVIEAAEQCGRSDIPHIREPLSPETIVQEYNSKINLLVCDEQSGVTSKIDSEKPTGALIGPEGGWSIEEISMFKDSDIGSLHLGNLTLRAETAAVAAATKLLQ
jgi:16S rRNA (uracil1498-N3)-methyltransferase